MTDHVRDWHEDFEHSLVFSGPGAASGRAIARHAFYCGVLATLRHIAEDLLDGPDQPDVALDLLLGTIHQLAKECVRDTQDAATTPLPPLPPIHDH